jgi:hypothetical protein
VTQLRDLVGGKFRAHPAIAQQPGEVSREAVQVLFRLTSTEIGLLKPVFLVRHVEQLASPFRSQIPREALGYVEILHAQRLVRVAIPIKL